MTIVQPTGAVVVGASGGIGNALVDALRADGRFAWVEGLSRQATGALRLDLTDEASIAEAAARIAERGEVGLVIVATGLLHGPNLRPEKTWRGLEAEAPVQAYRVNAVGPALVAKHFLPLLPRSGKAVFPRSRPGSAASATIAWAVGTPAGPRRRRSTCSCATWPSNWPAPGQRPCASACNPAPWTRA